MLYPGAKAVMGKVRGQDSCLLCSFLLQSWMDGKKGALLQVTSAVGFFLGFLMHDWFIRKRKKTACGTLWSNTVLQYMCSKVELIVHRFYCLSRDFCYFGMLVTGILFCNSADFAETKKLKQCWSCITELICAVQHMQAVSHWVIPAGFPVPKWKVASPCSGKRNLTTVRCGSTSSYRRSSVLDTYQEPGDCLTTKKVTWKDIVGSQTL